MPTKLTKPVSRRIDALVVTVTTAGVELRHAGGRLRCLMPLAELHHRLNAETVRTRREAFAIAPLRSWCPRVGEVVFLSRAVSGLATGRVRSVADGVPRPIVHVAVGRRELAVDLNDLRPLPARLAVRLAAEEPQRPLWEKVVGSG